MTMKEMFRMVETHNVIARQIKQGTACICFRDETDFITGAGKYFDNYYDFRKTIRNEYQNEIADKILKSDEWMFDTPMYIEWAGGEVGFSPDLLAR